MKYISMKEYKHSDEYKNLVKFLHNYLDSKRDKYYIEGYEHYTFPIPPNGEYIMDAYDIPFFDRSTKFYYHKDGQLILNLDVFYYQLELFMKSLFIRIFWAQDREIIDNFAKFVWEEYLKSNDERFYKLKETAREIYDNVNSVDEFYKTFILNDDYSFMEYDDYIKTMKGTFALYGYTDLGNNLIQFPKDSIAIFEKGQLTKGTWSTKIGNVSDIKQLQLISSHYDKLSSIESKYVFVPRNKVQTLKSFNFCFVIIGGMFFPQLLLFPK